MAKQVRIQDLCKGGGGSRDFADIAQRSHGGGKNLGLKMGGEGARAPRASPPLDPHLLMATGPPVNDPLLLACVHNSAWKGEGGGGDSMGLIKRYMGLVRLIVVFLFSLILLKKTNYYSFIN